MSELERRVGRALRGLPDAPAESRRRAEEAALAALPAPGRRRRPAPWAVVLAAGAAAVVACGAALAATDRLEVRIGSEPAGERPAARPAAVTDRVSVPAGADGAAVLAGGRMWLRTRSGLGVQGLAATAVELSPNARYAAVGLGRSLVAMAPDGRRAWSHPTPGPVVAAAWAPNPILIAYVVRRGAGYELRTIEGDGDGDRLVDSDVAAVRPSWRADAKALAYVDAAGRAHVVGGPSPAVAEPVRPPGGRVGTVAFAPAGERLALVTAGANPRIAIASGTRVSVFAPVAGSRARATAAAWASPDELVVAGVERGGAARGRVWTLPVLGSGAAKISGSAHGPAVAAVAPLGGRGGLALAVRTAGGLQVWETDRPSPGREGELVPERILLSVTAAAGSPATLSIR